MARYIDADALIDRMKKDPLFPLVERYGVTGVIEAEPTADAVEVVRCKDCKHYWKNWKDGEPDCGDEVAVCLASPKDDAFCSEGERREDGEVH